MPSNFIYLSYAYLELDQEARTISRTRSCATFVLSRCLISLNLLIACGVIHRCERHNSHFYGQQELILMLAYQRRVYCIQYRWYFQFSQAILVFADNIFICYVILCYLLMLSCQLYIYPLYTQSLLLIVHCLSGLSSTIFALLCICQFH